MENLYDREEIQRSKLVKDFIKKSLINLKEAIAAIGIAAGEALFNGNNEPMKKALESYEKEVDKIDNLKKQYGEKVFKLATGFGRSNEFREIQDIICNINPDFFKRQCGIEK